MKPCTLCGLPIFNTVQCICEKCHQKLTVEWDAREAAQKASTHTSQLIASGAMTPGIAARTFETSVQKAEIQNRDAWENLRRWSGRNSLYLYGSVGTGKSFAAACCLNRIAPRVNWRIAATSSRRISKVAMTYNEGLGLWQTWCKARVLWIDDIEKAQWDTKGISALWELLDSISANKGRVIITSNYTPRELTEHLKTQTTNTALVVAALDRLNPMQTYRFCGLSLRGSKL